MSETHSKVLIIEDSRELAEIISVVVERMALTPLIAVKGGEAIDLIHEEQPDLILLDLALPDMRGWRILDAVRGEESKIDIPVVVITASDDAANRLMGKLRDVAAYMIKPFTPEEVAEVIGQVLALDASQA